MVDEFLDELTEDYTTLYKENAALKAKLKVLADKVEDYRATEDSMRATLLTAQRMADSIVREAEAKRDNMMAEAEAQAQKKIASLRQEARVVEERLHQGQMELARFIEMTRQVCNKQLSFLEELPELPVEQPVVAMEAEVKAAAIEETVLAAVAEQSVEETVETEEVAVDDYPEGDPFAAPAVEVSEPEVSEPTRRINLSELKFGRNYKGDE